MRPGEQKEEVSVSAVMVYMVHFIFFCYSLLRNLLLRKDVYWCVC